MKTPALADVPVRSADDLTGRWRALLDPPTFRARALWLAWFDAAGLQSPLVVPVDDIPESPDPAMFAGLRGLNETVVDARLGRGGHIAIALCRPGKATVSDSDDAWVAALSEAFDDLVDQTWSLHLAADRKIQPLVGPDVLGARADVR